MGKWVVYLAWAVKMSGWFSWEFGWSIWVVWITFNLNVSEISINLHSRLLVWVDVWALAMMCVRRWAFDVLLALCLNVSEMLMYLHSRWLVWGGIGVLELYIFFYSLNVCISGLDWIQSQWFKSVYNWNSQYEGGQGECLSQLQMRGPLHAVMSVTTHTHTHRA